MSYRVLRAADAHWRLSNQMGVANTNLAAQLEASTLGARLWRLKPGQASTRHRHRDTHELYVLIAGEGRIRIGEDLHTVEPLSAILIEPGDVRQIFNDTADEQLWLIASAPPEVADTTAMTPQQLEWAYPDGPKALPPELRASGD